MSVCGQFTDKNSHAHFEVASQALECGGRSFEVAFISAIVYLKKKEKSLAGSVTKCQGGLDVASEVWALYVA